jgi:hypothetical protein
MRVGRDSGIGRWTAVEIGADVHVVPLADARMHVWPQQCWCAPTTERHRNGRMYSHNALDGRR